MGRFVERPGLKIEVTFAAHPSAINAEKPEFGPYQRLERMEKLFVNILL